MQKKMKALYLRAFGSSDVLAYGDVTMPTLGKDDFLVKTEYIGLNFADIYRRRGTYHIEKHIPYINGYEATGTIVEAGNIADSPYIGRSILFVDVPLANAEYVSVNKKNIIFLPPNICPKTAATIGLQGLTADFLAHDLGKNREGDKVFITGISGGVGQILSQMLVANGSEVYGSASSDEKRRIALSYGVKEVYPSREDGWQEALYDSFDTVYDGVGSTVHDSLKMLKHRGNLVFFGMAGGNPSQIDLLTLLSESKSILTGDLWDFLTSVQDRKRRSKRLFTYIERGEIGVMEPTTFPLAEGKVAHDFLESGKSIGKVLLKP